MSVLLCGEPLRIILFAYVKLVGRMKSIRFQQIHTYGNLKYRLLSYRQLVVHNTVKIGNK